MASFCERLKALEAKQDSDNQTLNINCDAGNLEISDGNSVPLEDLGVKTVYSYSTTPGFNYLEWNLDSGPHKDPRDWDGPVHSATGYNLPTATPATISGINNDANVGDAENTDPNEGMRYGVYWGWVNLPANAQIRDNNQNTGELGFIAFASCCDILTEGPGGNTVNTSTPDRGLLDPVAAPEGWVFVTAQISDQSAFHGMQLQVSTDNGVSWANISAADTTATNPEVVTQSVKACEEVVAPWQEQPLFPCCTPKPLGSGSGGLSEDDVNALIAAQDHDDPEPSTVLPIADNEVDTSIRTGIIGASLDYARADHNHPIRRQANPGAPNLTTGGNFTIIQALTTQRFWSDEETVYFGQRYRVQQPAGNGWGWLNMPNIAGFQRPIVQELNGYRINSTAVQDDDGSFGATARGPVMDNMLSHWSFTQRLYGSYFRRDNPVDMYVTLVLKYIRN